MGSKNNSKPLSENASRILQLLLAEKIMTPEQIAKELDISLQEVKYAGIELKSKGLIGNKKFLVDVDN